MMPQIETATPDFSLIIDLLVSSQTGILLLVALTATFIAGGWLGLRLYLHRYGVKTVGTVTEAFVKSSTIDSDDFSSSSRMSTHSLKIQYVGPDRVIRTIKGSHSASELDAKAQASFQVGGKVPVYYLQNWPSIAVFYNSLWYYIVPALSLALALFCLAMAVNAFESYVDFAAASIAPDQHLDPSEQE